MQLQLGRIQRNNRIIPSHPLKVHQNKGDNITTPKNINVCSITKSQKLRCHTTLHAHTQSQSQNHHDIELSSKIPIQKQATNPSLH